MKARLQEIVDALDMQFDEISTWLDLDSGQVAGIPNDLMSHAEDEEEPPSLADWQKPIFETAKRIVATDRFLPLPTKFDVHEWEIMKEFSESRRSERTRQELLAAIHGSGAFRHFKNTVRRHGIEQDWFAFRAEALAEIAREWCKENNVEWE